MGVRILSPGWVTVEHIHSMSDPCKPDGRIATVVNAHSIHADLEGASLAQAERMLRNVAIRATGRMN